MLEFLNTAQEYLKELGAFQGSLVLFFFVAHYAIWRMYRGRLRDRQKEINRMAEHCKDVRKDNLSLRKQLFEYNKLMLNETVKQKRTNKKQRRK